MSELIRLFDTRIEIRTVPNGATVEAAAPSSSPEGGVRKTVASCTTPFAQARRAMQDKYLDEMAQRFAVPVVQIPLPPAEVKGLDMLAELGRQVFGERMVA